MAEYAFLDTAGPQPDLFNVWAEVPGSRDNWTLIAGRVSSAEAEVYRRTFLFKTNIEEVK